MLNYISILILLGTWSRQKFGNFFGPLQKIYDESQLMIKDNFIQSMTLGDSFLKYYYRIYRQMDNTKSRVALATEKQSLQQFHNFKAESLYKSCETLPFSMSAF